MHSCFQGKPLLKRDGDSTLPPIIILAPHFSICQNFMCSLHFLKHFFSYKSKVCSQTSSYMYALQDLNKIHVCTVHEHTVSYCRNAIKQTQFCCKKNSKTDVQEMPVGLT